MPGRSKNSPAINASNVDEFTVIIKSFGLGCVVSDPNMLCPPMVHRPRVGSRAWGTMPARLCLGQPARRALAEANTWTPRAAKRRALRTPHALTGKTSVKNPWQIHPVFLPEAEPDIILFAN